MQERERKKKKKEKISHRERRGRIAEDTEKRKPSGRRKAAPARVSPRTHTQDRLAATQGKPGATQEHRLKPMLQEAA